MNYPTVHTRPQNSRWWRGNFSRGLESQILACPKRGQWAPTDRDEYL